VPVMPEKFLKYVFYDRLEFLKRMLQEHVDPREVYLMFTRANPVFITYGPAGLNGSVKMVGFIPRREYLHEMLERAHEVAERKSREGIKYVLKELTEYFYDINRLDLTVFGALEMARKHTWENVRASGKVTLLFYTPPITSFEVRCDAEIREEGEVVEYLNIMHDLYHGSPNSTRVKYPAYVLRIREIYDKSASREGFDRLIYRASTIT